MPMGMDGGLDHTIRAMKRDGVSGIHEEAADIKYEVGLGAPDSVTASLMSKSRVRCEGF